MSWTRHLYDPVGAIARATGLLGRDRRPMTDQERMRQRTLGTRRFGADTGVTHGGAGRGYAEPSEPIARSEPIMADTPMAKPAPAASSQKPVADPWKPGAGLGGGAHSAGVRMNATASPAAALSGGAMSAASRVNPGVATTTAQANNAGGPFPEFGGTWGAKEQARSGNMAARNALGAYPGNVRSQAPIMSDYAPPPAPTGRVTRRPFP